LRGKRAGDFLWFRRAGKAYRINDPATLSEARALFAPLRALEPEQEDLRRREEALDEKEQDLDRREDDLDRRVDLASGEDEDDDDPGSQIAPTPDADRKELERQISEIRSQQREVEADSRKLESVERSLDAREDAIEREAESKLWTLIEAAVAKGLAKPD
jgi:chromosome segregation ATPase